jgi:hypothetical protein
MANLFLIQGGGLKPLENKKVSVGQRFKDHGDRANQYGHGTITSINEQNKTCCLVYDSGKKSNNFYTALFDGARFELLPEIVEIDTEKIKECELGYIIDTKKEKKKFEDERAAEVEAARAKDNKTCLELKNKYKISWQAHGFTVNGGKLQKCSYSWGNIKDCIRVRAKDYERFSSEIKELFTVLNDSDSQQDYFSNDKFLIWEDNPFFMEAKTGEYKFQCFRLEVSKKRAEARGQKKGLEDSEYLRQVEENKKEEERIKEVYADVLALPPKKRDRNRAKKQIIICNQPDEIKTIKTTVNIDEPDSIKTIEEKQAPNWMVDALKEELGAEIIEEIEETKEVLGLEQISLLDKFEALPEPEKNEKVKEEDLEFCKLEEQKYIGGLMALEISIEAIRNYYEAVKDINKNPYGSDYIGQYDCLEPLKKAQNKCIEAFISNIISYFNKTYKLETKTSDAVKVLKDNKELTNRDIINYVVDSLGGRSFIDESEALIIKNLKKHINYTLHGGYQQPRRPGVELFSNGKIALKSFFSLESYSYSGDKVNYSDKENFKALFDGVALTEKSEMPFSSHSDCMFDILYKTDFAITGEALKITNSASIDNIKLFKNGKLEIVFKSKAYAQKFWDLFCIEEEGDE